MTHCCRLARHDGVDTDTEFAGNLGITHPSFADHRLDCLPSFRCDPPVRLARLGKIVRHLKGHHNTSSAL